MTDRIYRLVFLCTGNSARSQMAEALLNHKGKGRFVAASAGTRPGKQVHPLAVETLAHYNVPAPGHAPQTVDALENKDWDFVITVCDNAKESCPVFPGTPTLAHWGMPDPTEAPGGDDGKRAAFRDGFLLLSRRIELLLALPLEKLDRLATEGKVRGIGTA